MIKSIEAALAGKTDLILDQVTFNMASLQAVAEADLPKLINQWGLGFGLTTAPSVFMGTEQAFDVSRTAPLEKGLVNFTLDCALPILSLCGGGENFVEKLTSKHWPINDRRSYTIHPNDYYGVHTRSGNHTWKCIAKVLAGRDRWRPLLDRTAPRSLGDLTYQIDLSAHHKRARRDGRCPTAERTNFLVEVAGTLRATARVLVVHGTLDELQAFVSARTAVTKAFLNATTLAMVPSKNDPTLRAMNVGGHRAIWCRPLNSAINDYLDLVGKLVQPFLPKET